MAYNDLVAVGALERLAALGVAVPGEISVIGCDDIFGADLTTPALTTVAGPTDDIGRAAVDALHVRLTTPIAAPAPRWFATRLIVRASTAPARRLHDS